MATESGVAANEMIGGVPVVCGGAASETAATMVSNPAHTKARGSPRIHRDFIMQILPALRVSRPDFAQTIRRRPSQPSDVLYSDRWYL